MIIFKYVIVLYIAQYTFFWMKKCEGRNMLIKECQGIIYYYSLYNNDKYVEYNEMIVFVFKLYTYIVYL